MHVFISIYISVCMGVNLGLSVYDVSFPLLALRSGFRSLLKTPHLLRGSVVCFVLPGLQFEFSLVKKKISFVSLQY